MNQNEIPDENRQSINISTPEQETPEVSFRERLKERLTVRDKTKARIILIVLFLIFIVFLIRDVAVLADVLTPSPHR